MYIYIYWGLKKTFIFSKRFFWGPKKYPLPKKRV